MSRHEFRTREHEIVVGWDHPLQTFFAQVWKSEPGQEEDLDPEHYDGSYDEPVLWVGTAPGDLTTVEALAERLEPYVTLPRAVRESLQHDLEGRREPTPHQKGMGSIVRDTPAPGAPANDQEPVTSDQNARPAGERTPAQSGDCHEPEAHHPAQNQAPARRHDR